MRIRNRILIYFVTAVTILAAVSLTAVFILFSAYREEEFQQRQKAKIILTINLISQYKEKSENLSKSMDELTINDFFDEKLMIFDDEKSLIFSSLDDLSIQESESILNALSPESIWLETKEGDYDVIGTYYDKDGKSFYAISKAYDEYGLTKLDFLKNTLSLIFIGILLTIVLISFFLSKKLAKPIDQLSEDINHFNFNPSENQLLTLPASGSLEIDQLYERFNQLLRRTNESMVFQKHAVQHISHELKTPISVLVSELERLKDQLGDDQLADQLSQLAYKAKFLGEIIHSLLQISKIEAGQELEMSSIRVDEILFDLMADLQTIRPDFFFDFQLDYEGDEMQEKQLEIMSNAVLLKQAFQNLLSNCIAYSDNKCATISVNCKSETEILVSISNSGPQLLENEKPLLFEHFFRGKNSQGKLGFGLGLVLTKKIIQLAGGTIHYESSISNKNIFSIKLPLR
ncbi:two-component sensor histidine kinase [Echinicola pacifica]|uniref:histidine kinase n=1 Tax=Echinicola pacifica TaxID=346377 RepID=A0A918UMZ4_9BACT|nr:HAMP domain-containing sensor histidine kinase [Echinicola pacifica]GGZ21820.1 two-component sensor histidine kinase [Echinicola pacifica]